ncbi:transmembrane protein 141 [Condylostylus longicornis]|uniref:transmembrane protein 141 n=1 Tax=Condylostylus longicornis TaxID=2530218 RepID=UPI00244E14B7|nr:transmembrane protein 141 [Condylostylus longicornis]
MNDIKQLKNQQREKHPGFDSYLDCMTRSLFTGLASFCLGFSGSYFAQKIIFAKLKYPLRFNILFSSGIATVLAYKITSERTKSCQAAWMAAENKHTILQENNY